MNIYFLTDYFYAHASSNPNWESIDGARLAQWDLCNNQVPSLTFDQTEFSIVTVPIVVQTDYVVVFQFTTECHQIELSKKASCLNMTTQIEYRSPMNEQWVKLADMADIACRTSLINTGYFKVHTLKLPSTSFSR